MRNEPGYIAMLSFSRRIVGICIFFAYPRIWGKTVTFSKAG